jgi:hypothetical protein
MKLIWKTGKLIEYNIPQEVQMSLVKLFQIFKKLIISGLITALQSIDEY